MRVKLPEFPLDQRPTYAAFLKSIDRHGDKIITWDEANTYEQKLKTKLEQISLVRARN